MHIGDICVVIIFGDVACYDESCIMVYGFQFGFGVLWSGGMDSGASS